MFKQIKFVSHLYFLFSLDCRVVSDYIECFAVLKVIRIYWSCIEHYGEFDSYLQWIEQQTIS